MLSWYTKSIEYCQFFDNIDNIQLSEFYGKFILYSVEHST